MIKVFHIKATSNQDVRFQKNVNIWTDEGIYNRTNSNKRRNRTITISLLTLISCFQRKYFQGFTYKLYRLIIISLIKNDCSCRHSRNRRHRKYRTTRIADRTRHPRSIKTISARSSCTIKTNWSIVNTNGYNQQKECQGQDIFRLKDFQR